MNFKKRFALLVTVLLIGCLAVLVTACGTKTPSEGGDKPSNEAEKDTGGNTDGVFRVGYARENITPTEPDGYPLAGYGRTDKRLSDGFLDYCYSTCVAYDDGQGSRLLMITVDIIGVSSFESDLKAKVGEAFGIPEDHVIIAATHTHSQVDLGQRSNFPIVAEYLTKVTNDTFKACQNALDDLKPATMTWNTVDLTGYNFVRHYFSVKDMAVGDNHNSGDFWGAGALAKHTTESNHIMYMVRIAREGGKDILVSNWRAHPTITGGSEKTNISSDFVGAIRSYVEKDMDCLFAYYQGEAGNQNPRTRLGSDVEYNPPTDVKKYGREVADLIEAVYAADNWETIATGPIVTMHELHDTPTNHSMDAYVGIAREIQAEYNADGWTTAVSQKLQANGLFSPYQCGAIISNSGRAMSQTCSLHATCIGDWLITNEESEMFDTNGTYVRDNSPSKFTFVMSYSDGNGYIPSQFAYDYGCYEADTARFAPGAGELLADRLVEMAKEMWGKNH